VPENGGLNTKAYKVVVVMSGDSKFCIIEDVRDDPGDAKTGNRAYKQRSIPIKWTQAEGCLRIGPVKSDRFVPEGQLSKRAWKVKFVSYKEINLKKVSIANFDAKVYIDTTMASGCTV
jgi:hypothetical protein